MPLYFALTFAATWSLWYAAAWVAGGSLGAAHPMRPVAMLLFYLGVFAPGIIGLLLTWRRDGGDGVRRLLGRLFRARVAIRWYLFAIGFFAAIKLLAALAHRLALNEWPTFGPLPWYVLLASTVGSTILGGQAGEELGWRGYALPRLAGRIGAGSASILIGILWASWHLPLFFIPGTNTTGQSFPLYLVQVVALSVTLAWLYYRTDESLLLTMLMHSAINNTRGIVPSAVAGAAAPFTLVASPVGWLTAGLLWICALYFLRDLSRMKGRAPEMTTALAA